MSYFGKLVNWCQDIEAVLFGAAFRIEKITQINERNLKSWWFCELINIMVLHFYKEDNQRDSEMEHGASFVYD